MSTSTPNSASDPAATRDGGIQVRWATADDVDFLVAGNVAMAAETEDKPLAEDVVRRGVTAALHDPHKGRYLMAEHDGDVVGQLMLTLEWSDWRNGWFWWIQSVYVPPSARRRGVYRALDTFVQQAALADDDVCGVRLYVEQDNTRAQQTYRSLGMHPTDYLLFERMASTPTRHN